MRCPACPSASTQSKTARRHSAPSANLNLGNEIRSALGDQRRRRVDRFAVEIPANAESQILRSDVFERRRVVDVVGAVEGLQVAGYPIAHVDIAVSQFDCQTWRDPVSKTCVK